MNRWLVRLIKLVLLLIVIIVTFIILEHAYIYVREEIYNEFYDPATGSFEHVENVEFRLNDFDEHYANNMHQIRKYESQYSDDFFLQKNISVPIVIWWTPFTLDYGSFKTCGKKKVTCFFSNFRRYRIRDEPKAFMFYGTDVYIHDLPLPRKENEDWALLHEESPKNNYLFSFDLMMRQFNHTATFKRESDLPLITQYLTSIEDLESRKYLVSTEDKNRFQKEEGLAPVAYIQTDCITPSDRDIYVTELMKHIKVDSYGRCLHNKDLPEKETVSSMNAEEFYRIIAKYKFVIAMENAVCDDYVTEKLWRSFYIGSVPIVYGSSKSKEIFPDGHSAIEVLDYKTPKELASHLLSLNENNEEYDKYLQFKRPGGVTNKILLDLMKNREWGINNDQYKPNYMKVFECLVCERMHENLQRAKQKKELKKYQASKEHYGCPKPYTFSDDGVLFDETNRHSHPDWKDNSFLFSYDIALAQLKVLHENYLPKKKFNFTAKEIKKDAMNLFRRKKLQDDL